jgi:hypothetical protein
VTCLASSIDLKLDVLDEVTGWLVNQQASGAVATMALDIKTFCFSPPLSSSIISVAEACDAGKLQCPGDDLQVFMAYSQRL